MIFRGVGRKDTGQSTIKRFKTSGNELRGAEFVISATKFLTIAVGVEVGIQRKVIPDISLGLGDIGPYDRIA